MYVCLISCLRELYDNHYDDDEKDDKDDDDDNPQDHPLSVTYDAVHQVCVISAPAVSIILLPSLRVAEVGGLSGSAK